MNLKYALKFMSILFCVITTVETLAFTVVAALYSNVPFPFTVLDVYKFPLVGFFGAIPILIMIRKEDCSQREFITRCVFHFITTSALVIGLCVHYGWVNKLSASAFIFSFAAVYATGGGVEIRRQKILADKLNERIKAFHRGENATHRDKP